MDFSLPTHLEVLAQEPADLADKWTDDPAIKYAAVGGYEQSGIGNERGVLGIRAFQERKHITVTSR